MKEEFGNIISRVQVTIITDEEEIRRLQPSAMEVYGKRDARMAGPDRRGGGHLLLLPHVPVVRPRPHLHRDPGKTGPVRGDQLSGRQDRQGDLPHRTEPADNARAKRSTPSRANGPASNQAVYDLTHHKLERFNAYTLMEDPMTSCGCFECIVAMTADVQAVIVVNREFPGMTPVGMKFSTLAGSIGGGKQTPGFIGVGRKYLISKKFIPADGGFLRIAWMPKDLKESMRGSLEQRAAELGEPGFVDKIADETVTTEADGLTEWMAKVDHPALRMPPLLQ